MSDHPALLKLPADLYSRNKTIAFLLGTFGLPQDIKLLEVQTQESKLQDFLNKNVTVHMGGATFAMLPFPDQHFDAVIAADWIERLPKEQRAKAVEELCRVSKNYVMVAAPIKRELIENAEQTVAQQYLENSGIKHSLLEEHRTLTLPEAQDIEAPLRKKGYAWMTIGEGNILNWTLYQLTAGAKQGEKGADRFTNFIEFYNKNLLQIGNWIEPTYRTFFVISKEKTLRSNAITEGLAAMNRLDHKTFCYGLKVAFGEDRKLLNFRKKQLNQLADTMLAARTKMTELKDQNTEFHALLQERQQTLNLMQVENRDKTSRMSLLEEQLAVLATEIHGAKTLIQKQDEELSVAANQLKHLRDHVHNKESALMQTTAELEEKSTALLATSKQLELDQKTLAEIVNSRGWKNILWYRSLKNGLLAVPRKIWKSKHAQNDANPSHDYQQYVRQNRLTVREVNSIISEQQKFQYQPVISVVMAIYNVSEQFLVKAIASLKEQTYSRWELCICDDASDLAYIKPLLERYAREDERIRVVFRPKNGSVVKALNDALKLAQGAYVGFLDQDDELSNNALYEVVKNLQEQKYDLLYSDEDKIDATGERSEPFFKPDWSPDLLLSTNYIGHFSVFRRKLLNELGGFREGFAGNQDYDLLLRLTEKTSSIQHIPKVLYHWRKVAPAQDLEQSGVDLSKKALSDALRRRCIEGEVEDGLWQGSYRVKRAIKSQPLISIIISVKDQKDQLQKSVESIVEKSSYPNFEILLVDYGSELLTTQEYLNGLGQNPRIRVLPYFKPFNHYDIHHHAAQHAQGDILVFLNADTEVATADWLEAMIEQAERVEVGAVGAKLLYNHAGRHSHDEGHFGQLDVIKNYSVVNPACLMMRKTVYDDLGQTTADLSERLRQKGYLMVYTPYAKLYHHAREAEASTQPVPLSKEFINNLSRV